MVPFLPDIPTSEQGSINFVSANQPYFLNNNQILGAIAGNANVNSSLLNTNAGFNFLY